MDESLDNILRIISKFTDIDIKEIKEDTRLEDLGLSSLDIITIAFEVEEVFKIRLEEEQLSQHVTIKDIQNSVNIKKEHL